MTTPEMIAVLGRAVEAMQATAERMMQNQSAWMAHQAQTAAQAQPAPGTAGPEIPGTGGRAPGSRFRFRDLSRYFGALPFANACRPNLG